VRVCERRAPGGEEEKEKRELGGQGRQAAGHRVERSGGAFGFAFSRVMQSKTAGRKWGWGRCDGWDADAGGWWSTALVCMPTRPIAMASLGDSDSDREMIMDAVEPDGWGRNWGPLMSQWDPVCSGCAILSKARVSFLGAAWSFPILAGTW